jgi:hypothetical protein
MSSDASSDPLGSTPAPDATVPRTLGELLDLVQENNLAPARPRRSHDDVRRHLEVRRLVAGIRAEVDVQSDISPEVREFFAGVIARLRYGDRAGAIRSLGRACRDLVRDNVFSELGVTPRVDAERIDQALSSVAAPDGDVPAPTPAVVHHVFELARADDDCTTIDGKRLEQRTKKCPRSGPPVLGGHALTRTLVALARCEAPTLNYSAVRKFNSWFNHCRIRLLLDNGTKDPTCKTSLPVRCFGRDGSGPVDIKLAAGWDP